MTDPDTRKSLEEFSHLAWAKKRDKSLPEPVQHSLGDNSHEHSGITRRQRGHRRNTRAQRGGARPAPEQSIVEIAGKESDMSAGETKYSDKIPGDRGNYKWSVQLDLTDGYLGITQFDGDEVKERVLLSPKQVEALLDFRRAP